MKTSRKLKVFSKHWSNEIKPVPEIKLTDKWIEALGFQIGDAVQIAKGRTSSYRREIFKHQKPLQ